MCTAILDALVTHADLQRVLPPRVVGCAHQQFLQKEPLRQRDSILCGVVIELEKLLLKRRSGLSLHLGAVTLVLPLCQQMERQPEAAEN